MKFINFFLCLWVIFAILDPDTDRGTPWIRIQSGSRSTTLSVSLWIRPFLNNDTGPFLDAGFSGLLKRGVTVYRIEESSNLLFKVSYVCLMPTFKFPVPSKMTKWLKSIDRPFKLRGESSLIRYIMPNRRLGKFFYHILKGLHQKISKKPLDAT